VTKKAKLQLPPPQNWSTWLQNLEKLQTAIESQCLCTLPPLELQRPMLTCLDPSTRGSSSTDRGCSSASFSGQQSSCLDRSFSSSGFSDQGSDSSGCSDALTYLLEFINTVQLLTVTALEQQGKGFMCHKLMDMGSTVARDSGIWELLIQVLDADLTNSESSLCVCYLSLYFRI